MFTPKGGLSKCINSEEDLSIFLRSNTLTNYLLFLEALNDSVTSKNQTYPVYQSPVVEKMLGMLNTLSEWVDEIPPTDQPTRFGNKSYRTWYDRLSHNAVSLMVSILPEEFHDAAGELASYLEISFGNRIRIDYGTGHETNFMAWLYCFEKLGITTQEDHCALIISVFSQYLEVMRKIQTVYWLEPAGSHGVWSLDDYQFLVFYFGSSQLIDHPTFATSSIHNEDIIRANAQDFMFFRGIDFVLTVKSGPFAEHSPIIYSLGNVIHWRKVNLGMMKMYKGEVIEKFPVMQHFYFGSIIKWED